STRGAPRRPGWWPAKRVAHLEEAALVGDALAVEKPPDQHGRLFQPVETLTETRPEVDAEGLVFPVEPATAPPAHGPPGRDVIEGRRQLRDDARIAERRRRDEQPKPCS